MNNQQRLSLLKEEALKDSSLPLKNGATNLVFGVGSPDAEILCIGEGPGYFEDIKAEPFVGNAGALLNRLLASVGIKREDVYITNVVMHRPPQNRDPEQTEIAAYQKYVDGIIEIIKPKLIITLGRFSMAKFMPGVFISSVHGSAREVTYKGLPFVVLPMYHPAAALRSGEVMLKIKNDFAKIPQVLKNIKETKDATINKKEEGKKEQMNLL